MANLFPKLVDLGLVDFASTTIAFFECADDTTENFERFRSVVQSLPNDNLFYIKMIGLLLEKFGKLETPGNTSEIATLIPMEFPWTTESFSYVESAVSELTQSNMATPPLPALPRRINKQSSHFAVVASVIKLIAVLIKNDRFKAVQLIHNSNLVGFLTLLTPNLVLCPESIELLASLVLLGTQISNLAGINDSDLESFLAAIHCAAFRCCLLLPAQFAALQLSFLSTFFSGALVTCRIEPVCQSMTKMSLVEPEAGIVCDILPDLASLRALFLSIAHKFLPNALVLKSRAFLDLSPCQTLIFGQAGLVSSLPVDLPFTKLLELGTLYSLAEDAENVRNSDLGYYLNDTDGILKTEF